MDVSAFDFHLPPELIAQDPSPIRGASRLFVLRRDTGQVEHSQFVRLGDYLRGGDLLVLNNTKVFPARLLGRRVPSGGAVECLLLRQLPTPNSQLPRSGGSRTSEPPSEPERLGVGALGVGSSAVWEALVHSGQKLKPGARMLFEGRGIQLHGEIVSRHFHGRRIVRLWTDAGITLMDVIERIGHVPLPPYIKRDDRPDDRERYQTVYARQRGSVAAPTAGLHFTPELLDELASRGVERAEVTLHVGYGTFKPIRAAQVEDHVVDPERFVVPAAAADTLTRAGRERRRVVAVGSTTCRVLESLEVGPDGRVTETSGEATLFIRPGHTFRLVCGLITNFHLPRSSLLVLVAAFAGRERILEAYREAVERRYRFYSYGDAMLIL
ncbi:MAG: tRNA preQ1(34) S-adenosylmethionine ribosyltransferase-isomerase QueA [Acidobacteria bacterium]|nr:tRNA preQ1(34) S-adenosylmethionine ribosyltransferase-isomerase QueA [Acidobacteriota bacterium]